MWGFLQEAPGRVVMERICLREKLRCLVCLVTGMHVRVRTARGRHGWQCEECESVQMDLTDKGLFTRPDGKPVIR